MSVKPSDLLARGIDIPWKAFVKESCEIPDEPLEKRVHELGFQGNEAKAAYEEIITQETTQQAKAKYNKSKVFSSENSSIPKSLSAVKSKKYQSSEDVNLKVTINMILKAVEQKDLKYLRKYVTQENVNLTDDFGWTPLMSAAYCGHLEIMEYLLSLGANRKARSRSGLTAAQLALKRNYLSIVALLKKRTDYGCNRALPEINTDMQSRAETEPLKDYNGCTYKNPDHCKEQTVEEKEFYCEICKMTFHQTTQRKHECSTLHIFNTKPKLPNAMYGISRQNKGYQMLLNTGWDEQGGLGPSGKGVKYPVKTCLKTDRKGIGQSGEKEFRVTHFKPGDTNAISNLKLSKQKCLKKSDREKLLNREARKDRELRIALS